MGKAEILEAISGMSVLELSELITEMEEKFGVSAAAAAVARCSIRLDESRPALDPYVPGICLSERNTAFGCGYPGA